tara:strand:- start:334 stop:603 length:270 start_codon:yes stop_codon:yes gene_type:complete
VVVKELMVIVQELLELQEDLVEVVDNQEVDPEDLELHVKEMMVEHLVMVLPLQLEVVVKVQQELMPLIQDLILVKLVVQVQLILLQDLQ